MTKDFRMELRWSLLLFLWWGESVIAQAPSTEHKIHNIVLYPDKHSWCKTTEIKQIVTYPGCKSVEIDNNVCVGACFSYSIPRSSPAAPGEVITPYCDSCQPQNFTWKEVVLKCESSDDDEEMTVEMTKKVQVISNCTCASCHKNVMPSDIHKPAEPDAADVPEIMGLIRHHQKHIKNEEVIDEDDEDIDDQKDESVINSVVHSEKAEVDNFIDVDEGKKEEEVDKQEPKEESGVEVVHVNKQVPHEGFHFETGPHHSLILKPDVQPEHHHQTAHHHKNHQDDEQTPSLLKNQFKIHDDTEFPDQLAVESRTKNADHSLEVLSVPELILKEHALLDKSKHEETIGHHYVKHHDKGADARAAVDIHNPGVKIVEVPHDHLTPAVDGAHVSYLVKHGTVKETE